MTYDACIRIARAYDSDALLGPVRGLGDMYDLGGLAFLQRESAPVVIDHDPAKRIGEVHELVVWPFTDGRWIVARARLDTPPRWLKQGTPASFSSRLLRSYELNGWQVVSRALVDEISIVSASHRALESCAAVVLLRNAPAGVVPPVPAGAAPREFRTPPGATIRRPVGRVLGVR